MPIGQAVNPAVPGAYINNVAPGPVISAAVTNQVAVVGSASWGPVNAAAAFSPGSQQTSLYGPVQNRSFDLGTTVAVAALAGATNFRGVRVTDGTDAAATVTLSTATAVNTAPGTGYVANDLITCANGAVVKVLTVTSGAVATFSIPTPPTATTAGALAQTSTTGVGTGATFTFTYTTGATITSLYTGSLANADTVAISAGSAASTTKVTITRPGVAPEVFDNIAGAGAAAWTNLVSALNNGQSGIRGASNLVVATIGSSTVTPGPQTYTLTGGLDGATTITGSILLGTDGTTRTGMYALRGVGPSALVLADGPSTTWAAQAAFALTEGMYAIGAGASGEYTNLTTVAATKASAGIDTYAMKVLVGDYLYFNDTTNNIPARLVSPAGFAAGKLAALNPPQSGLNKVIGGIVGSQSTAAKHVYSISELQVIGQAGLDLIANPCPGGAYFGLQFGQNTSSNAAINGDNYSRMVPFLDFSFLSVSGQFVGRIQTQEEQTEAKGVFDAFLYGLWKQKPAWISNPQGTQPYSVQLTATSGQQAAGYQTVSVAVQLGSIVKIFSVNLLAGQTVQLPSAAGASA